jgi:hypothetical protein
MSDQQKKKAPWTGLSSSKTPTTSQAPTKKKRPPWLWPTLIAFTGIIIVVIAFNIVMHSTHNTAQAAHPSTQTPDLATVQGIQQYTGELAQNSGASGVITSSHYDPTVRGIVITETVGSQTDHEAARTTIENDCFLIQQAIWKSKINLAAVEVHILAPLIDSSGNTTTGQIGICGLKEQTEQKFVWSNLTINQAWSDYDAVWMLPALNQPGALPFSQQEA